MQKFGFITTRKGRIQRFHCVNCGLTFTIKGNQDRTWRALHPNYRTEKHKERDISKIRVRGRINKSPHLYPLDDKCIFCGDTENLEHAHLDYEENIYVTACHQCNHWMAIPIGR